MKRLSKVVAVLAAMMLLAGFACAAETKAYYQFGGAQVTWGWDADGDKADDSEKGSAGTTWAGSLDSATGNGTIKVPVAKGDSVEIICLSWVGDGNEAYADHVMFTAAVGDNKQDVTPNKSAKFDVTDDVKELEITITWGEGVETGNTDSEGNPELACTFNDWCGNGVIVTSGGAAAGDATEAPTQAPSTDKTPATGDATSVAVLAVVAVLALGGVVVSSKKRA